MENKQIINSSKIQYLVYNAKEFSETTVEEDIKLKNNKNQIEWLSISGPDAFNVAKKIILNNHLDDFLNKLINDKSRGIRFIELENSFFLSVNLFNIKGDGIRKEQVIFITTPYLVCNIQKKEIENYSPVKQRIEQNLGIIRRKNADYLLFSLVEIIFEKYKIEYAKLLERNGLLYKKSLQTKSIIFIQEAEELRQLFLHFKNSIKSFRDAFASITNLDINDFNEQYFTEIKEQANYLINDLDFEMSLLDSNLSLYFSKKDHEQNQVIKTLTIISVIFMPISFIASVYGMNFEYMPGLHNKYGYPIVIIVMLSIVIGGLVYFKKKNWY